MRATSIEYAYGPGRVTPESDRVVTFFYPDDRLDVVKVIEVCAQNTKWRRQHLPYLLIEPGTEHLCLYQNVIYDMKLSPVSRPASVDMTWVQLDYAIQATFKIMDYHFRDVLAFTSAFVMLKNCSRAA